MDTHSDIFDEVEQYCEAAKIAPSTLGLRAVNNPRLLERLKRRFAADAETLAKVRAYMADNPPPGDEKGAAQ